MAHKPLRQRDKEILDDLRQFGALRTSRISRLHFPPAFVNGKPVTHSNGQVRLRFLREEKYTESVEQPSTRAEGPKEFIHFITLNGMRALAEWKGCDVRDLYWRKINKESTNQFLEHLLGINDIIISLRLALSSLPYPAEIVAWTDDALMKKGEHSKHRLTFKPKKGPEIKNALLIPDGHIQIRVWFPTGPIDFHFLIEWDTGSETAISTTPERNTLQVKAEKYKYIFESGVYEDIYRTKSGRILFVTSSERRLTTIKRLIEGIGGKSRFWLTTMDSVLETLIPAPQPSSILTSPIWYKAGSEGLYSIIEA